MVSCENCTPVSPECCCLSQPAICSGEPWLCILVATIVDENRFYANLQILGRRAFCHAPRSADVARSQAAPPMRMS